MLFQECERVIYNKNPLDVVICQLIFPPILKIDTEVPVAFQERVRKYFPNFSEGSEILNIDISSGVIDQIQSDPTKQILKPFSCKNYEFSSEDEQWKINLTRTFVSLDTNKYKRWETFMEKLRVPFEALKEVYSPDYFLRVGLRYIDVFNRSFLKLPDTTKWDELLQPYILGILGYPQTEVKDKVKNFASMYEIELSDDGSRVMINTKLVKAVKNDEICFMIDSDFYNANKTPIESTMERLNFFNAHASRLIQWCITDRLHNAMEPQSL